MRLEAESKLPCCSLGLPTVLKLPAGNQLETKLSTDFGDLKTFHDNTTQSLSFTSRNWTSATVSSHSTFICFNDHSSQARGTLPGSRLVHSCRSGSERSTDRTPKRVLFLNIDDWNDRNSVLKGHSQAVTPNLWELGFPRLRVTEIRALLRDHGQIIPGKA